MNKMRLNATMVMRKRLLSASGKCRQTQIDKNAFEQILQRHNVGDMSSPLTDVAVKFKLCNDVSKHFTRPLSSVEFNNITSAHDILTLLQTKPQSVNVVLARKVTIEEQLQKMKLPANMHFVPSKRDLILSVLKQQQRQQQQQQQQLQSQQTHHMINDQ
ncbi:hypothetical protein MIR68_000233 [Amoeboaphelidium protococcarum]|nr:hypothetical protein MIR68_000233 [Amoeboaphelidium protococcarum]